MKIRNIHEFITELENGASFEMAPSGMVWAPWDNYGEFKFSEVMEVVGKGSVRVAPTTITLYEYGDGHGVKSWTIFGNAGHEYTGRAVFDGLITEGGE